MGGWKRDKEMVRWVKSSQMPLLQQEASYFQLELQGIYYVLCGILCIGDITYNYSLGRNVNSGLLVQPQM